MVLVIISLFSCCNLLSQSNKPKYILKKLSTEDYFTDVDKYGEIQYNFFQTDKSIKIGNVKSEIDLKETLSKIYPSFQYDANISDDDGKEEEKEDQERLVSVWSCPKSKFYMEEDFDASSKPMSFPFKVNFTEILDHLRYVSDGVTYEIVFFSTNHNLMTGRDSYGVLSASIFKKVGNIWELIAFSPAITSQGQFGKANAPKKMIEKKKGTILFELIGGNVNGAPAEEDEINFIQSDYRLYSLIENKIEEILIVKSGKISASESSENSKNKSKITFWNSSLLSINEGVNSKYPVIEISTEGYVDESNFENYKSIENFPQTTKGKKSNFTWNRTFSPSSLGKYKLTSNDIK
jgi:hypothetical protein